MTEDRADCETGQRQIIPVSCACSQAEAEYWQAKVCTLLTEVDNIERLILRKSPTSAELRRVGKRVLAKQGQA